MAKYETLADLREAVADGQAPGMVLRLDNDEAYAVSEEGEDLFSMHPAELLEQALDLLGVRHESV